MYNYVPLLLVIKNTSVKNAVPEDLLCPFGAHT